MTKPVLPTIQKASQVDNELDSLLPPQAEIETKPVEAESKPAELPGRVLEVETAILRSKFVEVPLLEGLSFGYSARHHTMNFSTYEANLLRGWLEGLKKTETKLPNGKMVATLNDAVRWLAHQFDSN